MNEAFNLIRLWITRFNLGDIIDNQLAQLGFWFLAFVSSRRQALPMNVRLRYLRAHASVQFA
jgi:hypothetical protein